jgi:hypothetical protein
VDAADKEKGPVYGEAQDVARRVEIVGPLHADRKGPVEGWEGRRHVAERCGAVGALDEAVRMVVSWTKFAWMWEPDVYLMAHIQLSIMDAFVDMMYGLIGLMLGMRSVDACDVDR